MLTIPISIVIIIVLVLRAFDAELATLRPRAELSVTDSPIYLLQTLPDATPRSQQGPLRAPQLGAPPAVFDRLLPHLLKHIYVRDRWRPWGWLPGGGFGYPLPSAPESGDQLLRFPHGDPRVQRGFTKKHIRHTLIP